MDMVSRSPIIFLVLLVFLGACVSEQITQEGTEEPRQASEVEPLRPTPELTPKSMPTPTGTATPTATASPTPVATASPTPIATATPTTTTITIRMPGDPLRPLYLPCGYRPDPSNLFNVSIFENSHQFIEWTSGGSQLFLNIPFEGEIFGKRLFLVSADGSDSKFIFDPNPDGSYEYGFHADLSPDRKKIVFASCRHPVPVLVNASTLRNSALYPPFPRELFQTQIEIIELDGSWEKSITRDYQLHNYPVWSPDGSQIAYLATDGRRSGDIYRWRSDAILYIEPPSSRARNQKKLTPRVGEELRDERRRPVGDYRGLVAWPPSWSPDGQRIAFVKYGEDTLETGVPAELGKILHTVEAEGGDLARVADVTSPGSWSPDSRRIAYGSRIGGYSALGVAEVAEDGTVRQQNLISADDPSDPIVGAGVITHVNWSPDGEDILFVVTRWDLLDGGWREDFDLTSGVYIIGSDGSGLRKLLEEERGYTVAAWSPDSSKVAIRMDHEGPGRTFEVIIVERDGTVARVLERKPLLGVK